MMPPKRHAVEEGNVDSWLMSYADMITLLLCFFIIFLSVSEPKKDRLSEITEGIATRFGSVSLTTPFQDVLRSVQGTVENNQMFKDISVTRTDKGITMDFSATVFYAVDSAELSKEALPALNEIAQTLKQLPGDHYRIIIEGHTNDVPIHSNLYPSNWELSAARAARLARFLIAQGIAPARIEVAGFADTRPSVPNVDADGNAIVKNREKNQRVVVKLEQVE